MGQMNRRDFLTGALGLLGGSMLLGRQATAAPDKRPNLLLIMVDDMGYSDIGCYGGEIRTPNLDALAANGIRFTQFYNNAKCGPTRASLLTGLYSQQVAEKSMRNCVTLGEALRPAGYRTLMTGKWHASSTPYKRGFDRHFGLTDGCANFFNPGRQREGEPPPGRKRSSWRRWAIDDKEFLPYTPEDRKFYMTDAFTDHAIGYLAQYKDEGRPFLLYVAYTAPHYPLHAWPEDIARYRGKYMKGWDVLRRERHKRQIEMGLLDPRWRLSPRDDPAPAWDDVKDKEAWDLKMAVYAAMIDRVDQNIGRLIAKLKKLGVFENTLILFLSDNGGCAEKVHKTPNIPPGGLASYRTVDLPWANASNTPFRKYKSTDHEGGISTPLIAHWPAGIAKPGTITHQVGHIIDIMPTFLELAKGAYPAERGAEKVLPCEGRSLVPVLQGRQREEHEALYWQFGGYCAVRQGKWKVVRRGKSPWQLYDMEADRTELNDLAKAQPGKAAELGKLWDAWAARTKSQAGGKKG
jgi:arylsulfatase